MNEGVSKHQHIVSVPQRRLDYPGMPRPHFCAGNAVTPLAPTLAGNASYALLAQLCGDGTAAVARDAYYALVQQECVARSAAPHSGACALYCASRASGALLHGARCVLGHTDLRSSGIYTSSAAPARPAGGRAGATRARGTDICGRDDITAPRLPSAALLARARA